MKDTYTILEIEERNAEEFMVYFRANAEGLSPFRGSVKVQMIATKEAAIERINAAAFAQVKAKREKAAAEALAAEEKSNLAKKKKILKEDINSLTNVETPIKKPKEKKVQLEAPI